jgi:hypothetical protein
MDREGVVAGAPNRRSGILSEVGSISKYVETGEIQKCVWNNPLVILQAKLDMPYSSGFSLLWIFLVNLGRSI